MVLEFGVVGVVIPHRDPQTSRNPDTWEGWGQTPRHPDTKHTQKPWREGQNARHPKIFALVKKVVRLPMREPIEEPEKTFHRRGLTGFIGPVDHMKVRNSGRSPGAKVELLSSKSSEKSQIELPQAYHSEAPFMRA